MIDMKKIIIDGLNRVISPVCAFFSGALSVLMVIDIKSNSMVQFLFGITAITMGFFSWLAYKYTIRKE